MRMENLCPLSLGSSISNRMRFGILAYAGRNALSPSLALTRCIPLWPSLLICGPYNKLPLYATDHRGLSGIHPLQGAGHFRSWSSASTIAEPPKGITVQGVVCGGVSPQSDWLRKS